MSEKDKTKQDEAPPVGSVLPRRPTAGLKTRQGTAALPIVQRPGRASLPGDSWTEEPASDLVETTETESVSDEPPPRGATLRTSPTIFMDRLAPAPADARVDIGGLVQGLADSDPELAAEISGDYSGATAGEPAEMPTDERTTDDSADTERPAEDLVEAGNEDTSVGQIAFVDDDDIRRALGKCDEVIAAGPAPVSDLSKEERSAEKEEDMTTKDHPIDAHAPTTASTTIPGAKPAATGEKPGVTPTPVPVVTAATAKVPPKGKTPAAAKHSATAATAAIPADKTKPPTKLGTALKIVAIVLLALVLCEFLYLGWQTRHAVVQKFDALTALFVSPTQATMKVEEPLQAELGKKAKVDISVFTKKTPPPAKKPAIATAPALPTPAITDESVASLLMAVDELRKKTIAPDNGWEPVNENSPIARFVESENAETWPKNIEDCLPATNVVLDELDVVRCCLRLPTSTKSAACVAYSSRLVLGSENAMPF